MIRAAVQNDFAAIAEIERLSFAKPWSKEMLLSSFENPAFRFFVAGEKPCGYVSLMLVPPVAELGNLAVLPENRRQGVARMLLRRAELCAKEEGCSSITLEVRRKNTQAIALYQSAQYKEAGIRPRYYGDDDAIILWKDFD